MRICMFSNLFYPVVSGSSTQSRSLARELVAAGHEVMMITAHVDPQTPPYEVIDGIEVFRMPAYRLPKLPIALNFPWLSYTFFPSNLSRIERLIARRSPDLLHLHNHMFDLAFAAVRMKRRFRLPLVLTFHTVIKHAQPLYNLLLVPGDRWFLHNMVVRRADVAVCPDANMEAYVHESHQRVQTELIPYGINLLPTPSDAQVEEIRRRHDLDGKRVILSLGHVHEVRNRRDEVRALPDILKRHPQTVLLIVGAETTDTPRRLARQLGVEQAVIFAGARPYDEVPAYLALADCEMHLFYQDAAETTSLGIASLEAMSAGKAVIVAANPNSFGPGVLKDGRDACFVPHDAPDVLARRVGEVLDAPEMRRRMGEAASRTVRERFSWPAITERTEALYRRMLGQA